MFVPQVVIKTSRCRSWSRRFELMGFRKLPCMLSTVAGVSSMGGSERSSDKDLDPQALPFSRAICNGRFHVSSPWEELSFPYVTSPLARRFPCSLQEGDILLKHLTMLSIPFCLGLLMEGGQISYLMGKVRKKLTSQAPF